MILAITIWNERVSPVFEVSKRLQLFKVETDSITKREILSLPPLNNFDKVKALVEHQVDVLICGALTRSAEQMLLNQGLELHPFITGEIQAVLEAWQHNELRPKFKMPGCRRRRYRPNQACCCQSGILSELKNRNES